MPLRKDVKAKLAAKFGNTKNARIGGKGTVRRKRKAPRQSANSDEKRLHNVLRKNQFNSIPAIEEVNMFHKDSNKVTHFTNPRVQASIKANAYCVSGKAEDKEISELLPSIINQLGPHALETLKNLTSKIQNQQPEPESDEDIPELVEQTNFEEVSKMDQVEAVPEAEDKAEDKVNKGDPTKQEGEKEAEKAPAEDAEEKPAEETPVKEEKINPEEMIEIS